MKLRLVVLWFSLPLLGAYYLLAESKYRDGLTLLGVGLCFWLAAAGAVFLAAQ